MGYGHLVVLTVVAPLERHGVCVVLSSCVQLRKVVLGCFVSSISCICLVVCVLGNFQVDWCRVTMFSELLLLPFQATSWAHLLVCAGTQGLCAAHHFPRLPVPFPSETSDAQNWVGRIPETMTHSYCLGKAPLLLGFILFFPFCPSPCSSTSRPSSSPTQVCFMYILPARLPCTVLYIYMWILFLLCLLNIMFLISIHVFVCKPSSSILTATYYAVVL